MGTAKTIKDRVKELRRVPASELLENPKNWRLHPEPQKSALRAMLEDIGFAAAVLARELPDGRLELVDGHLRKDTAPDQVIPVLVLDLTEDEADRLLLTLDPLGSMAQPDPGAFKSLLQSVQFENDSINAMLAGISDNLKLLPLTGGEILQPPDDFAEVDEALKTEYCCPRCSFRWS